MKTEQEILTELENNTGTQQYFKIPFSNFKYTEGINNLINLCGCWWLISDLGIELNNNSKFTDSFLIVRIRVNEDKSVIIDLRQDTDRKPIYTKDYNYTDFPLKEYEFYLINGIFLLKSEY